MAGDTTTNSLYRRAGYSGLTSNVPTGLQTLKGFPWPEGTGDYVNVREKQKYIQSYSSAFEVERFIKYNTRVEKLEKVGNKWRLRSSELISDGDKGFYTVQSTDVSVKFRPMTCFLTLEGI